MGALLYVLGCASVLFANNPQSSAILEAIDIAPVWSVHRCGSPELLASDGHQYAAYYLRWEHAGTNRDRPIPKPWPEPTMLRVYKIAE